MHLTTTDTSQLCGYSSNREVDRRRDKNCLPFDEPRRVTYARQIYSLAQCLLLLIQDQLRNLWKLPLRESAWACRQVSAQIAAQWDMVSTDGWLVRQEKPEGIFNYWIANRAGIVEVLNEPAEDEYQWSPVALAAEEEMRSRNMPESEIVKLLLAMEGERLLDHYKKKPPTVSLLHITGIIETMEESARNLGMELPPRSDRAAWFGDTSK